jgi:hypothetical protein
LPRLVFRCRKLAALFVAVLLALLAALVLKLERLA